MPPYVCVHDGTSAEQDDGVLHVSVRVVLRVFDSHPLQSTRANGVLQIPMRGSTHGARQVTYDNIVAHADRQIAAAPVHPYRSLFPLYRARRELKALVGERGAISPPPSCMNNGRVGPRPPRDSAVRSGSSHPGDTSDRLSSSSLLLFLFLSAHNNRNICR